MHADASVDVLLEWGTNGARALATMVDIVVVVDVLSFSTAVEMATSQGAEIIPCAFKDERAGETVRRAGAALAGPRGDSQFSLSPLSYEDISPGTRVVLPSPNGAAVTLAGGLLPVIAGCLRNARAVARSAATMGSRIALDERRLADSG